MEHEAALLLGILGVLFGITGVIVTVKLYYKVKNIEVTRRTEQKQHFTKLIKNNLEDALGIYESVTIISSRELFTSEELDTKTEGLQNLFKKKDEEIQTLARDTKFYVSMLSVIDTPTVDMNEVVEKIKWLTKTFYILDYPLERNKRHWVDLTQELQSNQDYIRSALSSLGNS